MSDDFWVVLKCFLSIFKRTWNDLDLECLEFSNGFHMFPSSFASASIQHRLMRTRIFCKDAILRCELSRGSLLHQLPFLEDQQSISTRQVGKTMGHADHREASWLC
jgi:hypothetical protein